jgi:hypothetical protein
MPKTFTFQGRICRFRIRPMDCMCGRFALCVRCGRYGYYERRNSKFLVRTYGFKQIEEIFH